MQKKGHNVLITASQKEISYILLEKYGFSFVKLGSYGKGLLSKIINLFRLDYQMYLATKSFEPDIFIGFGSIRAAHISTIMNKPSVIFDDSLVFQTHILYEPFTNYVVTPYWFERKFGSKQILYNGYMELAYLHPNRFTPKVTNLENENGLKKTVLIRFVGWDATHDVGQFGIKDKTRLVETLSKTANIIISSEFELSPYLENFRMKISPEYIHDVLGSVDLFICDGQTMTTEAALLGVPAIRCNSFVNTKKGFEVYEEFENKYGLIYNIVDIEDVISKSHELLTQTNIKEKWAKKRKKLLRDKIDVTSFMVDLIESIVSR